MWPQQELLAECICLTVNGKQSCGAYPNQSWTQCCTMVICWIESGCAMGHIRKGPLLEYAA